MVMDLRGKYKFSNEKNLIRGTLIKARRRQVYEPNHASDEATDTESSSDNFCVEHTIALCWMHNAHSFISCMVSVWTKSVLVGVTISKQKSLSVLGDSANTTEAPISDICEINQGLKRC
jgi:hypothetical protein